VNLGFFLKARKIIRHNLQSSGRPRAAPSLPKQEQPLRVSEQPGIHAAPLELEHSDWTGKTIANDTLLKGAPRQRSGPRRVLLCAFAKIANARNAKITKSLLFTHGRAGSLRPAAQSNVSLVSAGHSIHVRPRQKVHDAKGILSGPRTHRLQGYRLTRHLLCMCLPPPGNTRIVLIAE